MTTIIGMLDGNGTTWIAHDRRTTDEEGQLVTDESIKFFLPYPQILVAGAGAVVSIQLIEFSLDWSGIEKQLDKGTVKPWIVKTLVPRIRALVKKHQVDLQDNPVAIMIGMPGILVQIDPDLAVTVFSEPLFATAIGSGSAYAKGVLQAIGWKNPQKTLERALKAAMHLDVFSGGRPVIHRIEVGAALKASD